MEIVQLFENTGSQEFLLIYPTGSGKTRKGAEFAAYSLRSGHVDRIVVVVPHEKLLENTECEYRAISAEFANRVRIVTLLKFTETDTVDLRRSDKITLYVLDEIHNVVPRTAINRDSSRGPTSYQFQCDDGPLAKRKLRYFTMLKKCFASDPSRIVLGLTATPFSNNLENEIRAYRNLFELKHDVASIEESNVEFFAKRCIFPPLALLERYPSEVVFVSRNGTQRRACGLQNILDADIHFPLFKIYGSACDSDDDDDGGDVDEAKIEKKAMKLRELSANDCADISRKIADELVVDSAKHKRVFVVSYHLALLNALHSEITKRVTIQAKVYICRSNEDVSELHDKLQRFNASVRPAILLSSTFISEGLGLKGVTSVHLLEPFYDYVGTSTIQLIGRACRFGSHESSNGEKPQVVVRLYAHCPNDARRRNIAVQRERAIRLFLQKVRAKNAAGSSRWTQKPYDCREICQLARNKLSSPLTTKRRDTFGYKILPDLMFVPADDGLNNMMRDAMFHTSDVFAWFGGNLVRRHRLLADTSHIRNYFVIFSRFNVFRAERLARFINDKVSQPRILISGSYPYTLARHEITAKDVEKARAIAVSCDQANRNVSGEESSARSSLPNLKAALVKGAQIRTFSEKKLCDLLFRMLKMTGENDLRRRTRTKIDLATIKQRPNVIKRAIYDEARRLGCYVKLDDENEEGDDGDDDDGDGDTDDGDRVDGGNVTVCPEDNENIAVRRVAPPM